MTIKRIINDLKKHKVTFLRFYDGDEYDQYDTLSIFNIKVKIDFIWIGLDIYLSEDFDYLNKDIFCFKIDTSFSCDAGWYYIAKKSDKTEMKKLLDNDIDYIDLEDIEFIDDDDFETIWNKLAKCKNDELEFYKERIL